MSFVPPTRIFFPEDDIAEIQEKVGSILRSGRLTLGEYTEKFENLFATYIGTQHAIAVSSGTSAVEIVLRALGIKNGSVIVPTNTFFATAAGVVHAGLTPIFADCDETLALDLASLKRVIKPDTRAVIIVHIGGFITPHIQEIVQFCKNNNLFLIEDAAHAHGSKFQNRYAGTFGQAATFSFYPTKVMTSAEGGMIVTNDPTVNELSRRLRDQGKASFTSNIHTELGSNWRLSELHALIGLTQLKRLDTYIEHRRAIAKRYDEGLRNISGIKPLQEYPGVFSNYYKYIAFIDHPTLDRVALKKLLKEEYEVGLGGEVYELPLHKQPVFEEYAQGVHLPQAEYLTRQHICLPISAIQTPQETEQVLQALQSVFGTKKNLTSMNTFSTSSNNSSPLPSNKPMKVAVVGGSGFIGSHIVDKLLAAGHEVVVFDIMKPHRSDVNHMVLDVLSSSSVNTLLTGGFDTVYMLAAMANVNDVFNNPVEACDVNIRATVNILEAARKNKIDRVILSSTVWIYEMINDQARLNPVNEDVQLSPHKVNHVYTATKLAAEQYCIAYQKLYNQNYTILRYGIPYGPRARSGTVITNFVANALQGKPITIQGDGSQTRNFVYVEDLAEGNVAALSPQAANQTYNLEGLRPVSIKEIAEIVQSFIPDTTIEYLPARPGDFKGFSASFEKAKQELGWQPHTEIREGIRRYIEWAKTSLK